MTKLLVTGGAGYIGSHTVHLLRARGYDITVVDDLSRGHKSAVQGVAFHQLNLLDTSSLSALMREQKFDAVIHFAAYISVGESTQKPELYFHNNVAGSISLLTAMEQAGIQRIVFSSTAAVYGNPAENPIPENLPYAPLSPYGESKVMVEQVLDSLDRNRGVRSVCLRYFNACGAEPGSGLGEEHDPETHLIPLLLQATTSRREMTIFGEDYPTADGTCVRDYIHVSDLAQAHILAVESLLKGGPSYKFNVGTGAGKSVREVIRAVEQVKGSTVPYKIGPRRSGDPAELVANSDRLQKTLGWQPKYTDMAEIVRTAWDFERSRS